MLQWLSDQSVPTPAELDEADRQNRRKMNIRRYRSRTDVTDYHINAAFSWLRLHPIVGDELQPANEETTIYKTCSVRRGVPEEEALSTAHQEINEVFNHYYSLAFLTFNTSTAAAGSAKIKEFLDNADNWHELDVATLVTTTQTHKIHIYKRSTDEKTVYVILNNLDTPTVVFKIATAIMLDMQHFGEQTNAFAESWLDGNADRICTTVGNYYAEYKAHEQEHRREAALKELCKTMIVDRSHEFDTRIDSVQTEIDRLYDMISEKNIEMNRLKGEYLLYKLEDSEDKGEELKQFIISCGDKIADIRFTNGCLYIGYKTKLMYYEAELLDRYFESNRDNCINSAEPYIQQMLKDIFKHKKYNLLIETGAVLNTQRDYVSYYNVTDYISYSELVGIPNPHHLYYNCWGDNGPIISRAMMNKDYITAILQTFAAMSGLNIADSAVLEKFIRREIPNYSQVKCLEDTETGEIITMDQYRRRYEDNVSDETNE